MSFLKFLSMLVLTSLTTIVMAQTYPVRPVKLITNLPVGSGPDVIIRKYAEILSQNWKQPVLIDNRPGASGVVALEYFKNNKDWLSGKDALTQDEEIKARLSLSKKLSMTFVLCRFSVPNDMYINSLGDLVLEILFTL
jgi:hypothetical protein